MGPKSAAQLVALLAVMVCPGPGVSAQDANCNYSSYVQPNQAYYVYSPNYPDSYGAGITCRWLALCPDNYNCRLDCRIELPQSQNCVMDRLLVSQSGDASLAGAHVFCGDGNFVLTSTRQRISVGLLTSPYTTGGRFVCQLTAVLASSTNTSCSCGYKKTNRIVGGQETGVNEFPPMAALYDVRIEQIKCGGSIIAPRYVLTAAHCTLGHTTATLKVIVGKHNVNINLPQTQELFINLLLRHPQFNANTYDNDIGLLRTTADIVFSDRVGPVCLPFKYAAATFAGAQVEALGWGTQFPGGPTSLYLQKVTLDVISNAQCRTWASTVTAGQICTRTPGKDSCQDDSGGPLMLTESGSGLLFLAGVISSGPLCASESPAVNTRVTSHLAWIISNTPGVDYCHK